MDSGKGWLKYDRNRDSICKRYDELLPNIVSQRYDYLLCSTLHFSRSGVAAETLHIDVLAHTDQGQNELTYGTQLTFKLCFPGSPKIHLLPSLHSRVSHIMPHSHQKLICLKSGVSYSSTVSLPINQEY